MVKCDDTISVVKFILDLLIESDKLDQLYPVYSLEN